MSEIRNQLQNRSLSRSDILGIANEMEEEIGLAELLDKILLTLDIDTLRDTLSNIAKDFNL